MRLTLDLSDAIDVMRVREKIDTCSFIKKLIGKSSVSTTTEQSLIVFTDQLSVTNLYLIMQQHDLHTHLTLTTCKRGRQSTHTRNFKQAYYPFTETQTLIKHNLGYFETHMKGF
ncbi:MAG: hypothetical protein VXY77_01875 [Pseudomonadota bacterium]|nr:hypothetical protein [Pseudomonadota bacterium]